VVDVEEAIENIKQHVRTKDDEEDRDGDAQVRKFEHSKDIVSQNPHVHGGLFFY